MDWKTLNLCLKPGTRFFVGGHKVCRLEHKSAFSLWPCSHPLIIISSYKTIHSCLLHQGFVRISCEQSLEVPWVDPALGTGCVWERRDQCHWLGTWLSLWLTAWYSLLFNSSLAGSSVLWLLPISPAHPAGGQGCKGQQDFYCPALPQMKWSILPQAFPANLAGCYGLNSLINSGKPFHAASWWSIPPITCHFSSLETNDPSFCRQRCARKQKLLNSHSRQSYKILSPLSFPTTISW